MEGTWEWARSVMRSTGDILSPSSEGYAATLHLLPDSHSHQAGQYQYLRDRDVVATGGGYMEIWGRKIRLAKD